MFAFDITLAGDSSSTRTYSLTGVVDGNSARSNPVAPVNAPESLIIKHGESSRDGTTLDRHLVRFDLTKVNGAGVPLKGSLYVTIEVPRDTVFTSTIIKDMRTQMSNFLTDANVVKLLNREP